MTVDVPVLIVGGGVVGMTASMLLAKMGIESLLVTYGKTTSPNPRAHILNQRTMEIFCDLGIGETVYEVSTPLNGMRYAGWYTGVAGSDARYGREIGRVEAWGNGWQDPDYIAASHCRPANYPQMYLEPILKARAEALSPGRIKFYHELVAISQDADGVHSTIRDRSNGETFSVRSKFVIAADGGRTVGPMLGIAVSGIENMMSMISVHFRADLSQVLPGSDVLTRFFLNPDFGGSWASGALLPEGPTQWGNHSEEWVYHMKNLNDPSAPVTREDVLARMRAVFGLPDFDPHIYHVSKWTMEGVIAERFREGRIFLMGDALKRHPPTGGLGMNSGVQEAFNFCWKLQAVLNGKAGSGLLDTYEVERRPVAANNVQRAINNSQHHFIIDRAFGLDPEAPKEENWKKIELLWDHGAAGDDLRERVAEAISAQRIGFRHHNLEVGYAYEAGALVPDGSPAPRCIDPVLVYEPSTRPGQPLPHAFLERGREQIALANLLTGTNFLLICGLEGNAWVEAAQAVARKLGVEITTAVIGLFKGQYRDSRATWMRVRGVDDSGAVLVRPDRFIAYRAKSGIDAVEDTLMKVMKEILDR